MANTPATSILWQPGITLEAGNIYHLPYGARIVALADGVAGAVFDTAEWAKFTSWYTGGLQPAEWTGEFFYEWRSGRTYPQGVIVARGEVRYVATSVFHESTNDFAADVAAGHWADLKLLPDLLPSVPPLATAPPSTAGVATPHTPPLVRFPVADEAARDLIVGQKLGDQAVLTTPDRTDVWNGTKWVPLGGTSTQTYTQVFTATAGQSVFTLAQAPTTPTNTTLQLRGTSRDYGTDFTVIGTAVTLTMPSVTVFAGDTVIVQYD